ncbi:gluconate 2-dehydrogenase [Paenibacillus sp. yr247]|uniref:2-hydroxyacid dehydrogenase n=1 Tax=Paenibacillus sp. yr247 TaxID=1761880 RepID=UPI00088025B7|nr:D-glycerate dehydrogenase [Paenibacillus sp. yr247]SDM82348.1 gluconate 2-dehydrogenase [Paenibacillus sp. yr247]
MNKPRVLVLKKLPQEVEQYISDHCEIIQASSETHSLEQLKQLLSDVDGLLQSGLTIDEELLKHASRLKIVSNVSVGYNNFDTDAMKKYGVIGTHTPDVLDDTVADLVLALMLAAARRTAELDSMVKQGKWDQLKGDEELFGTDVHHATLGIIGMGRIGEAVAKRAKFGFDMNILYANRNRKPEAEEKYGAQYRTQEQLLRESDFVVVMAPLTAYTHQLIGKEQFQMMKPTAIFINASRGQLVDEKALIKALKEGLIQAAALDVFEQEPVDPNNPLLAMSNVVTLPHIGSATAKTRFDMAMMAAHNVVAGVTGDSPRNIVPELKPISL